MLIEPAPTAYDLRFELFGTSVRVHPFFWLFSAILGWDYLNDGFVYLFLWVFCCFASILLHEFGHIWMGRQFGTDGYIVLYSFGGLAVGSNDVRTRWQRVAVSLAGPLIQLALFGALWGWLRSLSEEQIERTPPQVIRAVSILLWINLVWPLFNLLPVWPLDGGQVSRELCTWLSPRGGRRFSLILSATVAGLMAVNSLVAANRPGGGFLPYVPTGGFYTILLFGMLAYESWLLMSQPPPWRTG
jgi:Zn-dependent protease